jgi:Icc-related predicted phosphoesterase
MPLFGQKPSRQSTRIFFATDLHGSEVSFRKFINAAKFYEADALIMGGDVAGKLLVPIEPLD